MTATLEGGMDRLRPYLIDLSCTARPALINARPAISGAAFFRTALALTRGF
jgi:hypothetical protein